MATRIDGQNWSDHPQEAYASFQRDGYIALEGFLTAAELEETREAVARLISEKAPRLPREQVFYEELGRAGTLKQIQQVFNHDPFFARLMFESRFLQLAEVLLRGGVVAKNMQYFNKPPRIGKATPPHQDGYYFMLDPCEAATMWLALEEVDEENGCVRYVRGSHLRGMRPHGRTRTLGFSQGVTDYGTPQDLAHEVAFPAKAGDLLVHNAMTIHRADGNRSATRTRQALGFIYYSERAREDTAAHAAYQEKLAREMKEKGKI